MVRHLLRQRVVLYAIVALLPVSASSVTFFLLLHTDATVQTINMIAIVVGGQVSFLSHDRLTFGDRHSSLAGWRDRWIKFMPGQAGGFVINSLAAGILVWIDLSAATVYVGAMLTSGGATFSWNNWFSHRALPRPKA